MTPNYIPTTSMQPEHVEIHIDAELDSTQRSLLEAKLEEESGIVSAWFEAVDHHRLTVHYDKKHFSQATLLDTIKEFGFHGKIIRS